MNQWQRSEVATLFALCTLFLVMDIDHFQHILSSTVLSSPTRSLLRFRQGGCLSCEMNFEGRCGSDRCRTSEFYALLTKDETSNSDNLYRSWTNKTFLKKGEKSMKYVMSNQSSEVRRSTSSYSRSLQSKFTYKKLRE